jgi:MFS family permease
MLPPIEQTGPVKKNHPLAIWMVVIAFINQNMVLACIFGPFSVLLGAVETRFGIGRELSTLAVPAVQLASAICAPLIGVAVGRISIRLMLIGGSALSVAGFAVLALVPNYPAYLIAYAMLLGPGMAIGLLLPNTLVTRWYSQNRGKALGIVNTPILISLLPLISTFTLRKYGLSGSYATLAALSGLSLIANFFIIDRPPGSETDITTEAHGVPDAAGAAVLSVGALLWKFRFWVLTLGYGASAAASIIFGGHTVPMARSWGLSTAMGATLVSITFVAGMPGAIFFGWIADRLGGTLTFGILIFDQCLLYAALLLHPPFIGLVVIFAIFGLHAPANIPLVSLAISETFGKENFSRGFGLISLFILPLTVLAVPAAAVVFTHTGSYSGAILGEGVFLAVTAILAFAFLRRRPGILIEAQGA